MMKTAISLGLAAAFISATIASADDVTIIKRHTDVDPDTTGSVVIKERQPEVVRKTVVIKKQQPDVVIRQDDEDYDSDE